MFCIMLILLVPYAIYETRALWRLGLLWHEANFAQFGLAVNFIVSLCYVPGAMLFLLVYSLTDAMKMDFADDPVKLVAFSPAAAFTLPALWIAMTAWLRHTFRRDLAIYREPAALVPAVVLAMVCLTYIAAIWWCMGRELVELLSISGMPDVFMALVLVAMDSFVPGAPLIGFIMLIVHVARVRAAKTWETFVPEDDEPLP